MPSQLAIWGVQMAKVGVALTTGQTGAAPPSSAVPMEQDLPASSTDAAGHVSGAGTEVKGGTADTDAQNWVQPQSFKSLVGKGHADFSSGHQQVLLPGKLRQYYQPVNLTLQKLCQQGTTHLFNNCVDNQNHVNMSPGGKHPPTANIFQPVLTPQTMFRLLCSNL